MTAVGEDQALAPAMETLRMMTRRTLAYARTGTVPLAGDVAEVPAEHYHDPARWRLEMDRVFRRMPLVLGFSAELRDRNRYKAMDVAGVPVLLIRGADGELRSFVNSCSHRGAVVMEEGSGKARRFTCPYHAWSYNGQGELVGIFDRAEFGPIDPACHGLTPLGVAERAGIVFGGIDPSPDAVADFDATVDAALCGYDEVLATLGLDGCYYLNSQSVTGPNWKVAYDGYLDFYHLPILHKNTFGPDYNNKAIYDAWGPHQRVSAPDERILVLDDKPEDSWSVEAMTSGIWTVFPHVSIARFKVTEGDGSGGGQMFMVSTLYPGEDPGSSITHQHFLAAFEPLPSILPQIEAQQAFLMGVVRDEDYATGIGLQRALATGAKQSVLFGRNEGGGQRFHGWVDRLVAAETEEDLRRVLAGAEVALQP
ncbi:MAG: aromatic ring-hydroxylating dioxygenase subunit alpha [Actinomycetota bacterium]